MPESRESLPPTLRPEMGMLAVGMPSCVRVRAVSWGKLCGEVNMSHAYEREEDKNEEMKKKSRESIENSRERFKYQE